MKALLRPIVADLQGLFERIPGAEQHIALGNYVGKQLATSVAVGLWSVASF